MNRTTTTQATLLMLMPNGPLVHTIERATTIGRDRQCDIVIAHPTVSRIHATIEPNDEGWRFIDHSAVNRSIKPTRDGRPDDATSIDLRHAQALRFGRVRAHFFIGEVPANFEIPAGDQSEGGHLVRCRCGRVGFVPLHDTRAIVRCKACDGPIEWRPSTLQQARQSCGACHSDIKPGEAIWVCPRCLSVHHADCHAELGSCATFGCGAQPPIDLSDVAISETIIAEADSEPMVDSSSESASDDHRTLRWAQIVLLGLLGMMAFGALAWGLLVFWLVRRIRAGVAMYVALVLLGIAGVGVSIGWWIGGLR